MDGRKKRTGGYSSRARSEHPDVRVLKRGGTFVLRYVEPGSGQLGKVRVRQESLRTSDNSPVTSREVARDYARKKAAWLAEERARIVAGGSPIDRDAGWDELMQSHASKLNASGSSPKTLIAYQQAWQHFERWPQRPASPSDLTVSDLQSFLGHLRAYRSEKTQGPLSKHSVAAHARHLRAILNYGRKVVRCIRLDGEAVGEGLKSGKLPRLLPPSYDQVQLRAILRAAREYDAVHPRTRVFPFIAFLMVVGCRLGEAEALRWLPSPDRANPESWVDFKGGRLVIFGRKTQIDRTVPLPVRPHLTKLLRRLRQDADVTAEPYVFGGPMPLAVADRRRSEVSPNRVGRSLKSAIDAVKKAVEFHWSPHSLRSNLATYMANSPFGANLYTLAGELGHDYPVLVRHYAGRRTLSSAQRSARTIEDLLGIASELKSERD